MRALRAIGAIFRASSGFDRQQAAELYAIGIVEFPMTLLRRKKKIGQGLPVNLANLLAGPHVTHGRMFCRDVCSSFRQLNPPDRNVSAYKLIRLAIRLQDKCSCQARAADAAFYPRTVSNFRGYAMPC